jgi:predicted porin
LKTCTRKTWLAPGLLALLPALACADSTNVTIYGRIHAGIDNMRVASTAAFPRGESATRVSDYSSKLGFRGREELGDGWSALFQIEGGLAIDAGTGGLNEKDTFVGLAHKNYGQVQLGRYATPIRKINDYTNRFLGEGPQDDANISQLSSDVAVGFNRRQPNSISYRTPRVAGFTATVLRGANVETDGGDSVFSSALQYEGGGPLTGAVGYEAHNNVRPGMRDKMVRVMMNYAFGAGDVGAGFNRIVYQVPNGTLARNYYTVTGAWKIGTDALIGRIGIAGDVGGSAPDGTTLAAKGTSLTHGSDSGAKHVTLGYQHNLSKRTQLYAYFTRLANERLANYSLGTALAAPARGASMRAAVLGVVHVF